MKPNNHNKFIFTSITKILEDAISASKGIGYGIENYALYDYIMQSVFLKMTGAQEQKFKCIIWELATNDYEFRRDFLVGNDKLSMKGMSHYDDKQKVYSVLIQQIKKYDSTFDVKTFFADKIDEKRKDVMSYIKEVFENTNFAIWSKKHYDNIYPFLKYQQQKNILEKVINYLKNLVMNIVYKKDIDNFMITETDVPITHYPISKIFPHLTL